MVWTLARVLYFSCAAKRRAFRGSASYWQTRYRLGGTSGARSYSRLAGFKAEVLNGFVRELAIHTVIECGCGDSHQVQLARYPAYLGVDVSREAFALCRDKFAGGAGKAFELMYEYAGETAELTLSLDVVYHLVDDGVFEVHMHRLFDSSSRYVIVYSPDMGGQERWRAAHIRHRQFTGPAGAGKPWVAADPPHPQLLPQCGGRSRGGIRRVLRVRKTTQ